MCKLVSLLGECKQRLIDEEIELHRRMLMGEEWYNLEFGDPIE